MINEADGKAGVWRYKKARGEEYALRVDRGVHGRLRYRNHAVQPRGATTRCNRESAVNMTIASAMYVYVSRVW